MNREIIFRGKSTNNGKWVYAELHGFGMDLFNECVQENTVGQFTGLHDKNGKKIYEVDKADCLNGGEHVWELTPTFPKYYATMQCKCCGERRQLTEEERKKYNVENYI